MIRLLLALALAATLPACGRLASLASGPFSGGTGLRGAANDVEGVRFRTRLSSDRADRRSFSTATRGAARAPAAAVEAGRVEAVGYCLRTFGGSQIDWTVGPDLEGEIALADDGALVLRGRCVAR